MESNVAIIYFAFGVLLQIFLILRFYSIKNVIKYSVVGLIFWLSVFLFIYIKKPENNNLIAYTFISLIFYIFLIASFAYKQIIPHLSNDLIVIYTLIFIYAFGLNTNNFTNFTGHSIISGIFLGLGTFVILMTLVSSLNTLVRELRKKEEKSNLVFSCGSLVFGSLLVIIATIGMLAYYNYGFYLIFLIPIVFFVLLSGILNLKINKFIKYLYIVWYFIVILYILFGSIPISEILKFGSQNNNIALNWYDLIIFGMTIVFIVSNVAYLGQLIPGISSTKKKPSLGDQYREWAENVFKLSGKISETRIPTKILFL